MQDSFVNWTKRSSEMLAHFFLYVDYTADVEELRTQFEKFTKASPLWDGRVCVLQVTDLRENTMQLRGLVSAKVTIVELSALFFVIYGCWCIVIVPTVCLCL
jgi:hypothetical protein